LKIKGVLAVASTPVTYRFPVESYAEPKKAKDDVEMVGDEEPVQARKSQYAGLTEFCSTKKRVVGEEVPIPTL
jgi:hypothetical protein